MLHSCVHGLYTDTHTNPHSRQCQEGGRAVTQRRGNVYCVLHVQN